jgi:hypothetical protein
MVVVTNDPIWPCAALHVSKLPLSDDVRFGMLRLASIVDLDMKYINFRKEHSLVLIFTSESLNTLVHNP